MTGKSCTIVAEWVLMAAAALNDALALKYSERTNHQWLFYFILSGRKTHIKNCKTWIRFVKKKLAKGNTQQTSLVVCPRSLTHSCSSTIGEGLWKAQEQFWGHPGCAFHKTDKLWSWLENCWREKKPTKNLHGKWTAFLLPTFVRPALVPIVKSQSSSSMDGDKLF